MYSSSGSSPRIIVRTSSEGAQQCPNDSLQQKDSIMYSIHYNAYICDGNMVSVLPFGQFGEIGKEVEKHGENLWNLSVMSSHRAVFQNFTQFLFDWGFPALFRDVVL